MRSAVAIVSGETSSIPAARARSTVAALRPSSDVSTRAPCSTRRTDIALPMAPGERIAITMFMEVTPFACVYGIGLKQLNRSPLRPIFRVTSANSTNKGHRDSDRAEIDLEAVGSRAILEVARHSLDRHLARFQP